ncbi:conjugal transfer protein TraG [Frankia sp. CgS1]|nr:conjugal transfer protein TraG [Frankia sp. CgIS1]
MGRAVNGRGPVLPWVILGGLWGSIGVGWLAWMTVRLAAVVGGGHPPAFGAFVTAVLAGDATRATGATPAGWVVVFAVLALAAATALAVVAVRAVRRARRRRRRSAPWRLALPSLADPADLATLTPAGAADRARALRPSLSDADARRLGDDAGLLLGDLLPRGLPLRASWEDVLLAVMAPRAGKTTALAIPMTLAAPGPVLATGNKADLWAATAQVRAGDGRRVWTFDPQAIAHAPQTWWWNPLAAVHAVEDADRLAGHFLQEIRGEKTGGDFWQAAAGDLLAALFLAAATSGRTLLDVYEWLNDSASPVPAELLAAGGYPAVAAGLRGRQAGAPETREGVYETARAAARCLRNDRILAWVTPGHTDRHLDVTTIPASRDVLHLLSKTDEGAASPLVAALTDQIVRAAVTAAERTGGRLDPPLALVLDEAANICKIADLPDLYSHLGSRGIVPLTILQSYRQGVRVWGEAGMDALWSAATIKIIGAGIDDPRLADDLSRLVGDHDVDTTSISYSAQGASSTVSSRRQRILEAADIRAIPKGRALLLATGSRIAAIALRPWYTGPRATEITAAIRTAEATLTARATGAHPAGEEETDDSPLTHL